MILLPYYLQQLWKITRLYYTEDDCSAFRCSFSYDAIRTLDLYDVSLEYHDTVVSNQRQLPTSPAHYIICGHTELSVGGLRKFRQGSGYPDNVLFLLCF